MTAPNYEPAEVAAFYDSYAEREWARLEGNANARLIGHLHRLFLSELLRPGIAVLDAGCGAGRFSLQCLEAGARVSLLDLSPVQLKLAHEHCAAYEEALDGVHLADLRDLSCLGAQRFDLIVCYGSVLCYLLDEAPRAVSEMAARLRPGGHLVISVGSRMGLLRFAAANPKLDAEAFFGRPDYWHIDAVLRTGTLPAHPEVEHPPRHFFSSDECRALFDQANLTDVELACAPAVSSGLFDRLTAIEGSASAWKTLLSIEEASYREPGLLDGGEFILARGHRPA